MARIKKKHGWHRLNILIMKPGGGVFSLTFSPTLLAVLIIFVLVFSVASIAIMHRYFSLYLDYSDLNIVHKETTTELRKLQEEYSYRIEVVESYNEIMNAMNQVESPAEVPELEPVTPAVTDTDTDDIYPEALPPLEEETGPLAGAEISSLENWANLFPDPDIEPEHLLEIEKFNVTGGRFEFNLINQNEGDLVQGNILLAFEVETASGENIFIPYPSNFDLNETAVNFLIGPGYSIRSSKWVNGRITVPAGAKIVKMMVVAKALGSDIVLKKKVSPGNL